MSWFSDYEKQRKTLPATANFILAECYGRDRVVVFTRGEGLEREPIPVVLVGQETTGRGVENSLPKDRPMICLQGQ